MTLRRKIDDVFGLYESAVVEHEHLARSDLFPFAGGLVGLVIRRPFAPELQGNAFAHNADGVYGIDDRVDALFQQVTLGDFDGHCFTLSIIPTGMPRDISLPAGPRQCGAHARLHVLISYPDLGYCSKRQALVHEEFGLSNFPPLSV